MNTVGLVCACPTIGHTQFIAVRIGKMKVFCPKNWESTLANNSTGDNEVSSLEFGGTVFSQKPNWTYVNCVSWCILHFRPFLAPFQIPILLLMIVDVQSYICCWMSYSIRKPLKKNMLATLQFCWLMLMWPRIFIRMVAPEVAMAGSVSGRGSTRAMRAGENDVPLCL